MEAGEIARRVAYSKSLPGNFTGRLLENQKRLPVARSGSRCTGRRFRFRSASRRIHNGGVCLGLRRTTSRGRIDDGRVVFGFGRRVDGLSLLFASHKKGGGGQDADVFL